MQAQYDASGLIQALSSAEPAIRRRAAVALLAMGALSAIPTLQQALVGEQDSATRQQLAVTLQKLMELRRAEEPPAPQREVDILLEKLDSKIPKDKIEAARGLAKLKDKTTVEPLVMVFHHTQLPHQVRLAAAEALIELESAPAVVTLMAALRARDWHVRRNAAAVLGQLRADWATGPLITALQDENEVVRRTARAALKRIATPEAIEAIRMGSTGPLTPPAT